LGVEILVSFYGDHCMPLKALPDQVLEANSNWCVADRFCIHSAVPAELTAVRSWWPSGPTAFLMPRCHTLSIHAETRPLARELRDTDWLRSHGRNADFGQPKEA
jgi:hypothetical protein